MYLRINLFFGGSHVWPGQHEVPLFLKHFYIYFKWRLAFKNTNKNNNNTQKNTHPPKKTTKKQTKTKHNNAKKKCINLPRAWIHRSIPKRIYHCGIHNKNDHLHVHIQWIVILTMRLFPESKLSLDSLFKFEYPGSLKKITMTCLIILFRFNV